jgi:hypothetical protein
MEMERVMNFYNAKNVAYSGEDSVVVFFGMLFRGPRY